MNCKKIVSSPFQHNPVSWGIQDTIVESFTGIARAMKEAKNEYAANMKDLILELEDCEKPMKIKVYPFHFLSHEDKLPDWGCRGHAGCLAALQEQHERFPDDTLLIVYRDGKSPFDFCRLRLNHIITDSS